MKFKSISIIVMLILILCSVGILAYEQSPMLEERVNEGELPEVEKRLPDDPVVVEPENEIGEYGGTLRMGFAGPHYVYGSMLAGRFTDQGPYTWNKNASELKPNWIKKAQISDDGKTFTINLREGLKWSDGEPVTTEDFMFTYEDIAYNEDLNPGGPPNWLKNIEVEEIDKYTIEFNFEDPNPLFKYNFQTSSVAPFSTLVAPKHYFERFHPKYTDEEVIEEYVEEEGLDNWWELFELKAENENEEKPVLKMWKVVEANPDYAIVERNPYYWKVDSEGNQLPYVDKVRMDIVGDGEVVTMKTMAGEYDFVMFHIDIEQYPTLNDEAEKGEYNVMLWEGAQVNAHIKFNQTYNEDEEIGNLLQEPDFRKALSLAIDRDEVNDLVYLDTGKAVQVSPPAEAPIFKEEYPEKYANYNPEKAKEMLDEVGLKDMNDDGWRELPNGDELILSLMATSGWSEHVDVGELVKDYWEDVGIRIEFETVKFERRSQREESNNYETSIWKIDDIIYPNYLQEQRGPMSAFAQAPLNAAPRWSDWLQTDGEQGEKPSDTYLELNDIYEEMLKTTETEKRKELTQDYFDMYYENLWTIGVIQQVPSPIVVKNSLKNVPEEAINAWPIRTPSNTEISQWYIEE